MPKYNTVVGHDNASLHLGDVYHVHNVIGLTKEQMCHQTFKTRPYEKYKNRNPLRVDGTCHWVLTHPQFQQWRQSKHDNILWVSADPGCGKSVLARSLIDCDLQDDGQTTLCYFFFKDNEEQNNLATATCTLLHQLYDQQPCLIRHAISRWEKNGDKLQQETEEMWRISTTIRSRS